MSTNYGASWHFCPSQKWGQDTGGQWTGLHRGLCKHCHSLGLHTYWRPEEMWREAHLYRPVIGTCVQNEQPHLGEGPSFPAPFPHCLWRLESSLCHLPLTFQPAGLCVVLRINLLLCVLSVPVPVPEAPRGELWCVRMKTDTRPVIV